jgi:hypothetical protein
MCTGGSRNNPVYDLQDAFYVPLAGFTGIVRPGPDLTIYALAGVPPPEAGIICHVSGGTMM